MNSFIFFFFFFFFVILFCNDVFLLSILGQSTSGERWLKKKVNELQAYKERSQIWDFLGGSVLRNLPGNVGDLGDRVRFLSQEDSLVEEMATDSSNLA